MRIVCTLAILTLDLGTVQVGHAQLGDLLIDRISTVDGLSNNNVVSIAQDAQGFLWFGTWDGLNRYDGSTFRVFYPDPADASSLSHSWAEKIYVDRAGTLWVGTHGGGLNRFDAATETFTHFRHDPRDPTSLSHDIVTAILEDHTGVLWVGTHGGLNRFDRETRTFTRFIHDPDDSTSLSHGQVRVLFEDRNGKLWVGTGSSILSENPAALGGLNRFDRASNSFVRYLHDAHDPQSLIDNRVDAVLEDSRGMFWVGTVGGVLHQMDQASGTFERFVFDVARMGAVSRPMGASLAEGCDVRSCGGINFLHEDPAGVLWVGINGSGFVRYDPTSGVVMHHTARSDDPNGLANNLPWSIAATEDGTIWIGGLGFETPGLHRVLTAARPIPHYRHVSGDPHSLSAGDVWGLHVDRDGVLWVATLGGGLGRLDPATGRFRHYLHEPQNAHSLSSDSVLFIHEGRTGALWIGTVDGGLNRLDSRTGQVTRVTPDPGIARNLDAGFITAILEDSQGTLWVGSWGGGLGRFDETGRTFTRFRHHSDDPNSMPLEFVTCLYEDRQGAIWVGTEDGLSRFDRSSESFSAFLPWPVTSLFEDAEGRFWVGTSGMGLHLLDRRTGSSTRFTAAQGLPGHNVGAIAEDHTGQLWVSTWDGFSASRDLLSRVRSSGGLARFDPETRSFRVLTEADGLPEMAFHPQSAARGHDGTLYFGGSSGFVALDPSSISETAAPRVVLTGLRLFNETVRPGPDAPLRQAIALAREIRLRHAQRDITISYAGMDFSRGGALRFQYRLEDHDADWVDARGQQSARYSRLSPGRYVFRVRSSRSGDAWGEASIGVVVLPPWWRTWWAYVLYGLVFACIVLAVDRVQRRRLVRNERQRASLREKELRAESAEHLANYLQAENRRQTQELDQARQLQLSMLPRTLPQHPAIEIAAHMQTATEVGGDYYDVHLADDGTLTFVIGDATGHGLAAGTMVTAMKGLFSDHAEEEDLDVVMHRCARSLQRMHLPKLYMALALGRLTGDTLELIGAGMPPALVYRAGSERIDTVSLKGLPLGSPGTHRYQKQYTRVSPGDVVLLMSDGLPELRKESGEMLGYERMPDLLREAAGQKPDDVIAHMIRSAHAWGDGLAMADDMTFLVLQVLTSRELLP